MCPAALSLGRLIYAAALGACVSLCPALLAGEAQAAEIERAFISIIIDDMGYRLSDGLKALHLPGPIAFSFLPHTPHARRLAQLAGESHREILLHLPMEALQESTEVEPGALTLNMDRGTLQATAAAHLASIPGVMGVNNHMGSLLTREALPMAWLMETLKLRGMFFVDSRTIADSVAARIARQYAVPTTSRDVFLDNIQDRRYIQSQFRELLVKARRKGTAVAIAHPRPFTLEVLARELGRLEQLNVKLISLTEMIERRQEIAIARARPSLQAAR